MTCNQGGTGQVATGTSWCRTDGKIWICKEDGKWARTGKDCKPSSKDIEASVDNQAPDADEENIGCC